MSIWEKRFDSAVRDNMLVLTNILTKPTVYRTFADVFCTKILILYRLEEGLCRPVYRYLKKVIL